MYSCKNCKYISQHTSNDYVCKIDLRFIKPFSNICDYFKVKKDKR